MSSPTNASATFDANEWRIIGLTSAGHTLCHIGELAYAAVLTAVMVEFDLTADRAAALAVPGLVLFGIGGVPAGMWTDRQGARPVMIAYFFLLAAAACLVWLAGSALLLGVALTALGAAISIYHPVGLTMLSSGCRQRGRAMGINGVAGSLGVATGPALGLWMMERHGWRSTYLVIAVLSLCCGLVACWVKIESACPKRTPNPESTDQGARPRVALLLVLFLAMMVGGFNYRCLTTALPSFLSSRSGATASNDTLLPTDIDTSPPTQAAVTPSVRHTQHARVVFLVLAIGGVGQFLGGYLSDRFSAPAIYPLCVLVTIPFAFMLATGVGLGPVAAACGLVVFMFSVQPMENSIIADATPRSWLSTVYGLKFILAFGIAATGAYATGLVWERFGLPSVFHMYAIGAGIMASIAALFGVLWTRYRRA